MVYAQILNFGLEKLSHLDNILLIGAINTLNLNENGFEKILVPILDDIRKTNESEKYQIKVKFFAGDTPASQSLGGFIEAVGNANFPCRDCLIEKKELIEAKRESDCLLRNYEKTKMQSVVGPYKEGIKRASQIYKFDDICNPFDTPQDPMHVILEGIARRLIIDFFKLWLQEKRTTIIELNSRFLSFSYNINHKKDKIKIQLKDQDLYKNELIISAAQMRLLLVIFPLMFQDIVDRKSKDYKLINLLRKITMLVFAHNTKQGQIELLEVYIEKFLSLWETYYGLKSGFPKLHYLVHIPKWIRK